MQTFFLPFLFLLALRWNTVEEEEDQQKWFSSNDLVIAVSLMSVQVLKKK